MSKPIVVLSDWQKNKSNPIKQSDRRQLPSNSRANKRNTWHAHNFSTRTCGIESSRPQEGFNIPKNTTVIRKQRRHLDVDDKSALLRQRFRFSLSLRRLVRTAEQRFFIPVNLLARQVTRATTEPTRIVIGQRINHAKSSHQTKASAWKTTTKSQKERVC